jgi:hypothetical protein
MRLYYCPGGGFGHVSRYLSFCHTFALEADLLFGPDEHGVLENYLKENCAGHFYKVEGLAVYEKQALREVVERAIRESSCRELVIDAFPGGIMGELCDFPALQNIECIYLSRHLQWAKYLQRVKGRLPDFREILIAERLQTEHWHFCRHSGSHLREIGLSFPPAPCPEGLPENFWLVIHSGSEEELCELWHFALDTAVIECQEPDFVLVYPGKRPQFISPAIRHLNFFPAYGLFAGAERVFSAAGFNIMQQMKPFKNKHHVMPFERSLDDQFFRASVDKI